MGLTFIFYVTNNTIDLIQYCSFLIFKFLAYGICPVEVIKCKMKSFIPYIYKSYNLTSSPKEQLSLFVAKRDSELIIALKLSHSYILRC